jgi:FKBP-type peptidyl-prolyl cis-trans isomerase SlyD
MTSPRRYFAVATTIISSLVLFNFIGCKKTSVIEKGLAVKINYTLTVDGKVVDTSEGRGPLAYVQGSGQIIPGLEEQMVGLKVGDKKQVVVPPEKAYGQLDPKALQKVPLKAFGKTDGLKIGMTVTGQNGPNRMQAKVVAIDKKEVTLDINHPLAGKTLTFDIEVVEIAPAPNPAAPAMPPMPQEETKPK